MIIQIAYMYMLQSRKRNIKHLQSIKWLKRNNKQIEDIKVRRFFCSLYHYNHYFSEEDIHRWKLLIDFLNMITSSFIKLSMLATILQKSIETNMDKIKCWQLVFIFSKKRIFNTRNVLINSKRGLFVFWGTYKYQVDWFFWMSSLGFR